MSSCPIRPDQTCSTISSLVLLHFSFYKQALQCLLLHSKSLKVNIGTPYYIPVEFYDNRSSWLCMQVVGLRWSQACGNKLSPSAHHVMEQGEESAGGQVRAL